MEQLLLEILELLKDLFSRYKSPPEILPNKKFAVVEEGEGFRLYVGDKNNVPVPHISGEERIPKEVNNTTQYTILAEDVDKILKFTANAGEEIQLIYNENTLPDNSKSIVAMSTGDNYLIPTVGTGSVTFGVPAGSLLKTTGENSLITLQPKGSVNDLAVWGSLEGEVELGGEAQYISLTPNENYSIDRTSSTPFVVVDDTSEAADADFDLEITNCEAKSFKVIAGSNRINFINNASNIFLSATPHNDLFVFPSGKADVNFHHEANGFKFWQVSGDIVRSFGVYEDQGDNTLRKAKIVNGVWDLTETM